MHALLLNILILAATGPTCINNFGKTACGYHCVAAHGELGCAKTAAGICGVTEREILCWDPPDAVRAHYGDHVPRPQCLTRDGAIACGYRCEGRDKEVRCATMPDGVCTSASRGIVCWDPPYTNYCADQNPLPRPQCISVDGRAACGYGCTARNGELGCAATPGGSCQVLRGQVVCTDPEVPPFCGAQPCRPDDPATGRVWCRPPPKN